MQRTDPPRVIPFRKKRETTELPARQDRPPASKMEQSADEELYDFYRAYGYDHELALQCAAECAEVMRWLVDDAIRQAREEVVGEEA